MDLGEGYDISRDLHFVYTRLPDHVERYRQWKIHEDEEVLVSVFHAASLRRPISVGGKVIAGTEFYGISYNFWDQWFNVLREYTPDFKFLGYYTDILTPIQKTWNVVEATDLFLDLFVFPDGTWAVKDEDEFEAAVERGLMDEGVERRARQTLAEIIVRVGANDWPPECVKRIPSDPLKVLRALRFVKHP